MKSTLEEFRKEVKELDKEIEQHYEQFEIAESKKMITDGIVNEKTYFESFPKTLLILKEPYDKDNEGECSWSLSKLLGDKEKFIKEGLHKSRTWQPVIYTAEAIYNGLIPWDWISYIKNEPEIIDALKNIAFMNTLKIPADTTTPAAKLKAGYNKHREILLRQIEVYAPDIIIFGGNDTFWNFYKDLKLDTAEPPADQPYTHDFWIKDRNLYIQCKHPSTTNRSDDKIRDYVDGITEIIRVWAEKTGSKLPSKKKYEPAN